MKTEATKEAVVSSLQIAEPIAKGQTGLRIIHKSEAGKPLPTQQENDTVQNKPDWDPAWFANYE